MAKITGFLQKVFGQDATNIGQIGSAALGTKVLTTDPETIQSLTAFTNGISDVTISSKRIIPQEEFMALHYLHTLQNAYAQQEGIQEYNVDVTYFENSVVKKSGTYELYGSLVDDNVGNALTDGTKWLFLTNLSNESTPSGVVSPYAGTTAPSGWLLCYGQAINRTTYAALFTAISTTYGVGDGSTTFNVPDLRGRVVAGQDDMGGTSANRLTDKSGGLDGDTLGDTGGSETHILTVDELASHTHTLTGISTDDSGTSTVELGATGPSTINTGSTGSNTAHNNVQPTIILNYIIKE